VPRASGPVLIFCAPGLIFGRTEGFGSRFHVLRAPNSFSAVPRASGPVFMFRGRQVPFSCVALPDTFLAVPSTSGPVFMFCAPGFIFGHAECVRSRFHVLRARISFRPYRVRSVPFSWFASPNSFSAVPNRGCRVPFSCFVRLDSFSAVPMASGPVFMFCAPRLVFGGIEGVRSRFDVFCSRTYF
jgi:hypothetical protein